MPRPRMPISLDVAIHNFLQERGLELLHVRRMSKIEISALLCSNVNGKLAYWGIEGAAPLEILSNPSLHQDDIEDAMYDSFVENFSKHEESHPGLKKEIVCI